MAAALLLGEDGRGYELARRLDVCGAWRAWLGESAYGVFSRALVSPAAWDAFFSPSQPQTQLLHLQLRARALLFDKASASLFLDANTSSAAQSLSNINPGYVQLHKDDVYLSLEDENQDGVQQQTQSKLFKPSFGPCKTNEYTYERASSGGLRLNESESGNTSQRQRHGKGKLPETWYSQYDKDQHRRTSEGMSAYLRLRDEHKRKRQVFQENQHMATSDGMRENGRYMHPSIASDVNNLSAEDISFFPEIMFPANCVPDSSLAPTISLDESRKVEGSGVLDNLPDVVGPSSAMMERFGIRPEYIKIGSKYRGKDDSGGNVKSVGQEQASQMTRKVAARLLLSLGFEGGSEVSMEVFSEFICSHICKLGRVLKLLSDSYRKQFSSIELLKMFLQNAGYSNFGILAEIAKDGNKSFTQQTPQNARMLQSQYQNPMPQAQQISRQMHPQMNMLHPQNLAFQQQQQQQQQWDKLRRRQPTTPRGSTLSTDKDHQPMVDVKIENIVESPMEFRHQQMAMANHLAQSGQQFKQLQSVQIPQLQSQATYNAVRGPPVKVEAFHSLVGGDSALKHDSDHSKSTSSQK